MILHTTHKWLELLSTFPSRFNVNIHSLIKIEPIFNDPLSFFPRRFVAITKKGGFTKHGTWYIHIIIFFQNFHNYDAFYLSVNQWKDDLLVLHDQQQWWSVYHRKHTSFDRRSRSKTTETWMILPPKAYILQ